jgi:hypothetical protein
MPNVAKLVVSDVDGALLRFADTKPTENWSSKRDA